MAPLDPTMDISQLNDIFRKITSSDQSKRDFFQAFKLFNDRHLSTEEVRILSAELASLKKDGIVRRKESAYKHPVYLNPDPDDPYKLLVDFTKFNYHQEKSLSIVPSAKIIWSIFRNKKYISTLKVDRAYYKVKLEAKQQPFTGFAFDGVDYVFNTLTPGLHDCEDLLQVSMMKLFEGMPSVFAYLETIFIFGETEEEHHRNVAESTDRLTRLRMIGNVPDGLFYQPSVEVLGFKISNNKVQIADEKLLAIKKTKCPKTFTQLLEFIVAARFYKEMIKGFSRLAAPLTDLLEEPQPLTQKLALKIEHESCFGMLKQKLLMEPVLVIFDQNADTYLYVSASKISIEGDLYQIDPETEEKHAIGYFSEKVCSNKQSWDLFELEVLATAKSFQYFNEYLEKCKTFFLCPQHPPHIFLRRYRVSDRLNKLKMRISNRGFNFRRHWSEEALNIAMKEMAINH